MRLNFKRIAELPASGGGPVVFPIVEETGEEIEKVVKCVVESETMKTTRLTLTVIVPKPDPKPKPAKPPATAMPAPPVNYPQ